MNEDLVPAVATALKLMAKTTSISLFKLLLEEDSSDEDKKNLMKAFVMTLAVVNDVTEIIKLEEQ